MENSRFRRARGCATAIKNDQNQFFKTDSPVIIWPEVVAYQKSFEGDLKRFLFNEWQLYNLSISPDKGFRGDNLARLRGIIGLIERRKIIINKNQIQGAEI